MNRPENQILIIFGASGDLAKRKLIPALFELYSRKLMPEKFAVVGAARTAYSDAEYRKYQAENIIKYGKDPDPDSALLDEFLSHLYYASFNTADAAEYGALSEKVAEVRRAEGLPDKIVFDLATPPNMYELIPTCLRVGGLSSPSEPDGWRRIIVEKPFGTDYGSALRLNAHLREIFEEKGIYRIDHYLGKETVQNILVLRFANGIFEPLWNRNYIDFVEISATETLGVENRGKYYDSAGALRDMVQNHLMHLMAFVAMEAPASFDPEAIRDEISKVFRSLHPLTPEKISTDVVRAQYAEGVIDRLPARAYTAEKNVAPDSSTETYVAMKFFIDNWRWGGVPFYFYTGKALPEKKSEIVIHFKSTPQQLFAGQCSGSSCNKLTLRIQPDESISLNFALKMPGAGFQVRQVSMDFRYDSLSKVHLPDAYERLLLDAMLGDSTLYARNDALAASWKFIDPILAAWKAEPRRGLYYYPAGSMGPQEGAALIKDSAGDSCEYAPFRHQVHYSGE